jgi:hypothetical protein
VSVKNIHAAIKAAEDALAGQSRTVAIPAWALKWLLACTKGVLAPKCECRNECETCPVCLGHYANLSRRRS